MSTARTSQLVIADPVGRTNPPLVVAAARAGGTGLLDAPDIAAALTALGDQTRSGEAALWLRIPASCEVTDLPPSVDALVLAAGPDLGAATTAITAWSTQISQVIAQVVSLDEAIAALTAGATGLLVSGSEAGGRVGDTEAFILLQQTVSLGAPVWVRGGIGLHTAAGAIAGGAAGVVLDTQLALTREADLPRGTRQAIAAMDGSETRVVGGYRIYTRPDLAAAHLAERTAPAEVAAALGADLRTDLVPIGQDTAAAARLAERFGTVGGVVQATFAAIDGHLAAARATTPLAPGHGIAASHGTRYPIAQGPMTRA